VLIGLVAPDAGTIEVHVRAVRIRDPQQAAELGIGMVHQHFSLVDELRVWENVVLGELGGWDRRSARRRVREIGDRYGLDVDPDARVADLSAGMRQRVEIVKCLRRDPDIVIFDEPTSVLTPQESEYLFTTLRAAVQHEGKAVALVSHKLDEVIQATDVITILRRGRVSDLTPTAAADVRGLATAMVGRAVSLRGEAAALGLVAEPTDDERVRAPAVDEATTRAQTRGGRTVLRLRGATVTRADGKRSLAELDLEVRAGEIVGVAGVEGNGQAELCDVLASLLPLDAGQVEVDGREVTTGRAGAMGAAGVALVPEDRHDAGCVLDLSVTDNLHLERLASTRALQRVDRQAMRANAERLIAEYEISCTGPDAPFRALSGGNQQRVVLARELSQDPVVLVAAQPTRGLDVSAIEFVGDKLRQAAVDGVGVLLVSSELEELLHLADRIVVLHRGRVVGELARAEADLERLGLLMGGVTA
jgi:ABC-type uncharacterized transport system ATPase subunit